MKICIEKARENDIYRLQELYYELDEEYSNIEFMRKEIEIIYNNHDYYLLVIKIDNEIIGTGCGIIFRSLSSNCNPYFVIDNVVITKKYQHKGYGTLLFKEFEKYIKKNHCRFSYLIANNNNSTAYQFYKKLGYTDGVMGFQKTFTYN